MSDTLLDLELCLEKCIEGVSPDFKKNILKQDEIVVNIHYYGTLSNTTFATSSSAACFNNNCLIESTLPPNLVFNDNSLRTVIVYSLLFIIAAVGNLTVFITLFRSRHRKSRINLMITHLAVADLMVTFIMIPLEIGWRITVQWMAGNVACKIFVFLRAFGLYLSSNVLVCISIDRYFAVLHPLRVSDARRRGKTMLSVAWTVSLLYALPQIFVFSVQKHPHYPSFEQCVTFGFFSSMVQEAAYNLTCVFAMYFIPLLIISFAYLAILCEIWKKSRESKESNRCQENGHLHLRRSDISNIERARSRTLRMTATIVAAFVLCWTPYVVMTLWYMFDRESALKVDAGLQDALFMMAVSNSCMNPLVYGSYAMNLRRECCNFLCCSSPQNSTPQNRYSANYNLPNTVIVQNENGDQRSVYRRLVKYISSLRKGVASGITRSTGTLHVTNAKNSPESAIIVELPKSSPVFNKKSEEQDYELTSFISEPVMGSSIRTFFSSDPTGRHISIFLSRSTNNFT
ncbi:gonadotropin-releasing hormone II receptor-like [Chrysoperla carnea]|uniref:gonadotropin-releasing hormone II receptor-like n=1 Tax=Chrysoperla carnea TaxID=189513 RepID=UPI001D08D206|nr:gonadotropin-releasing hormone II receptor-like [Chrysoperla carnea]